MLFVRDRPDGTRQLYLLSDGNIRTVWPWTARGWNARRYYDEVKDGLFDVFREVPREEFSTVIADTGWPG